MTTMMATTGVTMGNARTGVTTAGAVDHIARIMCLAVAATNAVTIVLVRRGAWMMAHRGRKSACGLACATVAWNVAMMTTMMATTGVTMVNARIGVTTAG